MNLIWVTQAQYISDYKIKFLFNDNTESIVDLEERIKSDIFKPIRNIDNFKNFKINSWTIEWDCGVDFAPEYLYKIATKSNKEASEQNVSL